MYAHLLDKFKNENPDWQEGTLKNTLLMVALILDRQTVCLWKLKGSVGKLLGNTETDSRSHYQRIKRWFKEGVKLKYLWLVLLEYSVGLLKRFTEVLIIDGTSWEAKGKTYHFLTLCLLYKGVAVPIWWIELGRLGISSQAQRKVLLTAVLKLLKLSGKTLIGDREYIGESWFKELKINQLDFVFRLRDKSYESAINTVGKSADKLERKVRKQIGRIVGKRFELNQENYFFIITSYKDRNGKIEILKLITTLKNASRAVELYKLRYRIEAFFKHLKTNGFQLEELNLQSGLRVRLMMALLVLAYTLSIVYGLKGYRRKYPPLKHGSPAMSVFRAGLDLWQNHLSNFVLFLEMILVFYGCVFQRKKYQLLINVP
jgi:Transposase DDE domain